MDNKVKYWLELSDYDFDTALAMLNSKRFLYVGFMCHQTIEKIFKAYKERLLKSLTYEKCHEIIERTKEMQKWIKEKL